MPSGNSPSGEAEQMPAFITSKWGLGRETRAVLVCIPTNSVRGFPFLHTLSSSSRGSYPTVWFASPSQFAQIALWAFRPDPYSKQCSLHLPAQPLLASGGCKRLCCFSAGGVTVGLIICGFKFFVYFSSQLYCPLLSRLTTDSAVRVFPGVWKLLSF